MAQEAQLAHRNVRSPNVPYQTNVSPTQTEPYFALGSADILTSINSYAERRPGFSDAVESAPTTFNNLQRLFTWDRNDGTFWDMACDINASGFAQVYYMQSGGTSFTSLYTDTTATPFDFVVSNNTVYFSNGNVAKKWDPINGISNWGIAIGSVNNATGYTLAGAGANAGGGTAWTNPGNVTSGASYASVTMAALASSQNLQATSFGFSLGSSQTVSGIAVEFDYLGTGITGAVTMNVVMLKAGAATGATNQFACSNSSFTNIIGNSSYLWGASWTFADINNTNFGVAFYVTTAAGGSGTAEIRNVKINIYGLGGPTVTLVAGGFSPAPTVGFTYEFCYGNSATGHISSPTPISALIKPDATHSVQVSLTASTDPQVNQIHLFRTTDGGAGTYFELPTSPYANTTANVVDAAADTSLNVASIAPTATFNDPPTPFRSPVYFSGRIWGFKQNKVYFSGLEEIVQGVPEESFPSGIAGNYWAYDEPVQGLGVAGSGTSQTQLTLCGGRIYGVVGNTLDTFQRYQISNRRGTRCLASVASLGGMVGWLDSSNQIWATDGTNLNELSADIRPDLVGLNPANCSMTFHVGGRFHWAVFSTGTKLYVYDMDLQQWMPPWSFSANYVYSGETSAGNYVLMAATPTKALQMNPTRFNDNGSTYAPVMKTGLMALVPDYGRRFSYMAMGIYDEPSRTGFPYTIQVTNNAQPISMSFAVDEDPKQATYTSLSGSVDTTVAFNRNNGAFMTQQVWQVTGPAARWISLEMVLANADQADNIYEYFVAYKPLGGR